MSEVARRESPLVQVYEAGRPRPSPDEAGVRLMERPFLGHVNLRGDHAEPAFLEAVASVLGLGLPLEPNTVSEGDPNLALWLGPDEWLVLTPPGRQTEAVEALSTALGETFHAVNDVSGGQTVITISGEHARDVLAKGCTLDLHPRAFGPGRCAQTLVAKASVVIRQLDESPSFDLVVHRSFADYLAQWLEDAAQEYGLSVE